MTPEEQIRKLREQLAIQASHATDNENIFRRLLERELLLLKTESLHELLKEATDGLANSYGLDAVSVVLWDPQHEIRHLMMNESKASDFQGLVQFVDSMAGLAPQYVHLRHAWLGPYLGCDHQLLFPGASSLESVALIPVLRQEVLVGCLNFGSSDDRRFTRHHATSFLDHLGSVFSFALENAVNRARLTRSGFTDVLTGWYNRRYLQTRLVEEIARAQRDQTPLTCLLLDVDFFKQVNDTYGHLAGDRVLRELAQRVECEVRHSDVGARFGGEEFAVLLPDTRASDAVRLAERIRKSVSASPIATDTGRALTVTVSIGIAEKVPEIGVQDIKTLGEALLAEADVALYRAKADGRNCVRLASD